MKKIIYSVLALLFIFGSCAEFEDYQAESYGIGPSTTIETTQIGDSSFVYTVTPGSETLFYSYVIQQADEPQDIDAETLLKGNIDGIISGVLDVSKHQTYAATASQLMPNTMYQIYAVGANEKGIIGEVKNMSVTTTDEGIPKAINFRGEGIKIIVTFSEMLKKGTQKASLKYYARFDLMHPVEMVIPVDNIQIDGKTVTFVLPDPANGVYATVSWEKGAFTDIFGNDVEAQTSFLNMETGQFEGVNYRVETVAFDVPDSAFVQPKVGSFFTDWEAFEGIIELEMDLYRSKKSVKFGDIQVVYTTENKESIVNLSPADWSVSGKQLKFKLPEEPLRGAQVDVIIKEGVFFDVYGNPNNAYRSEEDAKWTFFSFTKEMVLGAFSFTFEGDDGAEDLGTVTIEEGTEPNSVILKDFYLEGSEVPAIYDLDSGKLKIDNYTKLGVVTAGNGNKYGLITYNIVDQSGVPSIEFTINTDGTITCAEALVIAAAKPDYSEILGLWQRLPGAKLTKK